MLDSKTLAARLTAAIINPLIGLIFTIGLLVFVWGLIEFLWGLNSTGDSSKKEQGKMHMLWGLIGMFIMVAAFAILRFIDATIGSSSVQF